MNSGSAPRPTRARGAHPTRPRHGRRPAADGHRPPDRTLRQAAGRTAPGVVRYRRPWYRTRAFRLVRTLALAVVMMVGGARCAGGDASRPVRATPPATDLRTDARGGRPAPPARPSVHPTPRPVRPAPPPRPLPHSRAVTLAIPYLDVDAPVMPLRLDRGHRMSAPPGDDPKRVGWYADGPSPGEQGTAVAVGHLDTMTGPAVFAGLGELKPDRLIEVRRADGRTAVYTVDAVRTYEKAHFPDREVYGARGRPELRLITCGGGYDRRTGYTGNTVVFAHLVATRERTRTG